ncbi:MAG: hypothetical protein IPJ74_26435 [Saprospiraceae bacterium]|nr:hypothetical protein [Saprospiraceae bacterium]
MGFTTRFESAYQDANIIAEQSKAANITALKPIILAILEDLNKRLEIFDTEGDGSLKLNDRGFPIVRWGFFGSKIILNPPTILGYLARIWQAA